MPRIYKIDRKVFYLANAPNVKDRFIVRLYDGFDHEWIDVSEPVSKGKAQRIWNEKTNNGTKNISFDDIDYYDIFPADTVMLFSAEGKKRLKE